METVLTTKGLTKVFAHKFAVNNVNLNVHRGDIYGFIGKNGAGKTTLMRMAAGLAAPTSGEILLFESTDLAQQRRRIGTVIENPAIYPALTAVQNMEVQRRLLGIRDDSCIQQTLQTVGLADAGKKKAKNFSLGMKQRLGIGLALLGNPDFLILDEPNNGLDPEGIKEIRDLILKLNTEKSLTILISSHILGELSKVATCYGIINNGILIDEFSAQELEERCKSNLSIKVDDVQKASNVLETVLQTKNYQILPDNTIALFDFLEEPGKVNAELSKNGVLVESISVTGQDLEAYFLTLIGGAANV
jgi:ABC-2 type transport system ATP-binding protein